MRQYKWGILAPGAIANKFTAGLAAIPEAVLYAVASRDLGRAQAFAGKYGYQKAYGSYLELAKDPNVDIVYVATPHPQHEEAVVMCLSHGKAVICEKPIAVNAAQTQRMINCARNNGVFLMEAMWTRFLPSIVKVRELLAQGAIGKVRLVTADFGFRAEVNPQGRLFALPSAGGSLMDVGVYNLSFASMVYGMQPESVKSHLRMGSTGVDEEASLLLSYPKGQSALLFSAIRLNTPQDAMIFGESGRIELPAYWRGNIVRLHAPEGVQEFDLPYQASGMECQALEVMRCLDAGLSESPVMPLDESLAVIRTADGIRREHGLKYPCDE